MFLPKPAAGVLDPEQRRWGKWEAERNKFVETAVGCTATAAAAATAATAAATAAEAAATTAATEQGKNSHSQFPIQG